MEFANIIVLNKVELVNEEQKAQIKAMILALNPGAKIIEASYGKVDVNEMLDTHNFNFEDAYYNEGWVKAMQDEDDDDEHEHHHHDEGELLEYGIETFVYTSRKPFSYNKTKNLYKIFSKYHYNILKSFRMFLRLR